MIKLKTFIKKALFGGILVLLPLIIVGSLFRWAFFLVTDLIQPLTDYLLLNYPLPEFLADLIVILLMVTFCFVVGTLVTTSIGSWLHGHFDRYLARLAPGYRMVKEVVVQFFGNPQDSPFSRGQVARARIFGEHSAVSVSAIVTDTHPNGTVTLFVPTGPNPTSGNIYHIPVELVEFYPEAGVEAMMRTIIACGSGSANLFNRPSSSL